MPLLPFDLFNDETRLIMHNECLYKLKLTYKSEISLKKISPHQRDETNTELIKVIRAILFLIKAEKDIPRKISTPCFIACVAVKFWKITLKLGFSKNGTRLKSGHIIDLTLYMKQNSIQRREFSEANIWVNTEPYLENNQNKHIQQFGHLGLRQFVINSDESNSSSDVIPYEPSLHSTSAENTSINNISTVIDRPTEIFESFVSLDPLHGQAKPPDQPVTNGHNSISKNIDQPAVDIFESVLSPDSLHGQAKPSDISSDTILDEDIQTVSVSKKLVEQPPSSHSTEEKNASLQIEATFISSCTQTDTEELDFYTKKPDPNSTDLEETFAQQVHSDHNYFKNKAGNIISNPKEQPIRFQESETSNPNGSSVTDLASSLSENIDNEENRSSVGDEDVGHSSLPEDVSSQAQSCTTVDENVEILNAEPEDGALITNSDTNSKDNDIWGIENKQHGIISEVEIPLPIESYSEYSQDAMTDSSKYGSEITSDQCSKKYPEAHEIAEPAFQDGDSSNTERSHSSLEELTKNQYSKSKARREMVLKDIIRIKKSYEAVDCILPPKVKKEKNPKKTPKKLSTFFAKRISSRRKRNKSTPQSLTFISGVKRTSTKSRQIKETPKSRASVFHKQTPRTRESKRPRSKNVTPKEKKTLKSGIQKDQNKSKIGLHDTSHIHEKTPPTKEQDKRSHSRSKDAIHKEKKKHKSVIQKDQNKSTIGVHDRSHIHEKTPPTKEQDKRSHSQSKDAIHKEKKKHKSVIQKDQNKSTIGVHNRSQVYEKTPPIGEQRKRGRPRSRDVTPKEKTKSKIRIPKDEKEITISSKDGSQVHEKTPPIGKQSTDVTPKEKKNPKKGIQKDQKEITVSSNDRSQVHEKTPPVGKQRKRGRPRSTDVTPKEKNNPKKRIPEHQKEITNTSNDRSQFHEKTSPIEKQRKRGRPRSRDVTPKEKKNPKRSIQEDQKEITVSSNDRSQVHEKTPPIEKQRKRGRPRSRNVTPKEKTNSKSRIPEDEKESTIVFHNRFQVHGKTPPTGEQRKRGRPRSRDVTPKEKTNPKRKISEHQKEITISSNDRSQVHEKTPPIGKQRKRGRPQSTDVTPKEKTNPKSGTPSEQNETIVLHNRSQFHERTPPTGKQCKGASPRSKDITHKEKTNSKSGIPEDQITFGLHDRFQVQTQELQEDLKLQNLAHPSSTSPNKKGRSFMESFRLADVPTSLLQVFLVEHGNMKAPDSDMNNLKFNKNVPKFGKKHKKNKKMFQLLCPPAFYRCFLSNSGTFFSNLGTFLSQLEPFMSKLGAYSELQTKLFI